MVENSKDCVLRWAGHAGYITERFSGLLARQALVDVTLICEEQTLRVHKLVLASNSMYFEEILQQDWGQEPIIFLKDLNFEILKAMVEFMYCGQTTIPHHHLPSLLSAANIFKVKELSYVIDMMEESEKSTEDKKSQVDHEVNIKNNTCNKSELVHVQYSKLSTDECSFLRARSNNVNINENQSLETTEHEGHVYEESFDNKDDNKQLKTSSTSEPEVDEQTDFCSAAVHNIKDTSQNSAQINNEVFHKSQELKPILYEQCCDFTDIDECEQIEMPLPQSYLQVDKELSQCSHDILDIPTKVGKCVKVYTHKRRKSIDEVRDKLVHMNNLMPNPPSTDCIDLLDEPPCNDIPVALLTSLDMESAEYILSLSAENIQSIVGGSINEQHGLIEYKEINIQSNNKSCNDINVNSQKENLRKKELHSTDDNNFDSEKPTLRRSLRLNQHENVEPIYNNNLSMKESIGYERQFKKSVTSDRTELYTKGKRKVKDINRKVPDQIVVHTMPSSKKNWNNSRTQRNNSRFIVKKNNKPTYSVPGKEKEEHTPKSCNKIKCQSDLISDTINDVSKIPTTKATKLNTIGHINRALWGDMSDVVENNGYLTNSSDYIPNREIPFAVGLLPLRTALERMQAIPDYQPRKTRSSVIPVKHDLYGFKRKSCPTANTIANLKKQNMNSNSSNQKSNTVCHIKIRTAPSQSVKNRKKFLSEHITTLKSMAIINRR